jgi:PatG C-terminal
MSVTHEASHPAPTRPTQLTRSRDRAAPSRGSSDPGAIVVRWVETQSQGNAGSRPSLQDCWDVLLKFFNPKNNQEAKQVFRFTIDVSDLIPVTLGVVRSWSSPF